MAKKDTVRLLHECDAGADMAIHAIDASVRTVPNREMRRILRDCRLHHMFLRAQIASLLAEAGDDGKVLPSAVRAMAWIRIKWRLLFSPTSHTAAELLIRGCRMGEESLGRYLEQYPAASEEAKEVAGDLIRSEVQLEEHLRRFL